jgi:DNA-binding FrmR family transcriptional regulator
VTSNEPGYETIATDELARLRRVEAAAKDVLTQMEGRRSATTILTALAALRAALKPSDAP